GETTGQEHHGDPGQIRSNSCLRVQSDGRPARQFEGATDRERIRCGVEHNDAYFWFTHLATSTLAMYSVEGFDNNSAASVLARSNTSEVTSPSTVSSKRLPCRTAENSWNPSSASRASMAFPCGSSTSGFGMTSTTIVDMMAPDLGSTNWLS